MKTRHFIVCIASILMLSTASKATTKLSASLPHPSNLPTNSSLPLGMMSNEIEVSCEQENTLDYGDHCSWPFSQTGTRCCCWCSDPTGAFAWGHVMDLGFVHAADDVYFELRPGCGGCVTSGYLSASLDGSTWSLVWTGSNLGGWTTYSGQAHIPEPFRYIRATTDGCSIDWTMVRVAVSTLYISPNQGGNAGSVTAKILGSDLDPYAQVKLTKSGETDIIATGVTGVPDKTELWATFDLQGKTPGYWDLLVTNPDNATKSLPAGFLVKAGGEAKILIQLVGGGNVRVGRDATFRVMVRNAGDINAQNVVIILGLTNGLPQSSGFGISTAADVSRLQIEPVLSDSFIWVGELGPGFHVEYPLTMNLGEASCYTLQADAADTEAESMNCVQLISSIKALCGAIIKMENRLAGLIPTYEYCMQGNIQNDRCKGVIEEVNVLNKRIAAARDFMPKLCNMFDATGCISQGYEKPAACNQCGSLTFLSADSLPRNETSCSAETLSLVGEHGEQVITAEPVLINNQSNSSTTQGICAVTSIDPNDKASSNGYDLVSTPPQQQKRYVAVTSPISYMVSFENLETATASVQDMTISDQLDSNLDWSTFAFGTLQIGTHAILVPEGAKSLDMSIDFRPEMNVIVQVQGTYNQQTGSVQWYFRGEDPDTEELADFLPPNTVSIHPRGSGWVSYSAIPKSGLPTGTVIQNGAIIDFEVDIPPAPIGTPIVINTIDSQPPSSSVDALPEYTPFPSFQVNWSGNDDPGGSGIHVYTVYVSDNNGTYQPWIANTISSSAIFNGSRGHIYRFYTISTDNVGNVETISDIPDTTTSISFASFFPLILKR
jgi:uncharacterized repeat protein (TIGR01451 family)